MLPKTLKEFVTIFNTWATNHNQIEMFEYGEFATISISKDYNYPLMFVEQSESGFTDMAFNIYFLELWDSGNDVALLDCFDMTRTILHDFMMWSEKELDVNTMQLGKPFKSNDDIAIGWELSITYNYWNVNDCTNG